MPSDEIKSKIVALKELLLEVKAMDEKCKRILDISYSLAGFDRISLFIEETVDYLCIELSKNENY